MPRIPGPDDISRVQARAGIPAVAASAPANALADLGDTISGVANLLQERRRKAEDAGFKANYYANAETEYTKIFDEHKKSVPFGQDDFESSLDKKLQDAEKRIIESSGFSPSQAARQEAQLNFARFRSDFKTKAVTFKNNAQIDQTKLNLDNAVDTFASSVATDPSKLDEKLSIFDSISSEAASMFPPGALEEYKAAAGQKMSKAAILSILEEDPAKAYEILSNPDHKITGMLDAEDVVSLLPKAKNEMLNDIAYDQGTQIANTSSNLKEMYKTVNAIEDKELREKTRTVAEDFWRQRQAAENEKKAGSKALKSYAKDEMKDYLDAKKNGFVISDEERSRVFELVQLAGLEAEFLKDEKLNQDVWIASIMPANERKELIDKLEKSGTVAASTRHAKILAQHEKIEQAARDDGYSLGIKQGLIEEIPLNLNDEETFNARAQQSRKLSSHYGVVVSPFTDSEASNVIDTFDQHTINEKLLLANRINAMGPSASRAWEQISKKNAPVLAYAGAIASDNEALAKQILIGNDELKSGNVKAIQQIDYLPDFDEHVQDVYSGQNREAVRRAAIAAYAATREDYNSSDFKDILEQIAPISKINGGYVERPMNVSEDDFERYVDDFTPEAANHFGGVINASDKRAAELIQESKWVTTANNRYALIHPKFGPLFDNSGKPLIVGYNPDFMPIKRIGRRR